MITLILAILAAIFAAVGAGLGRLSFVAIGVVLLASIALMERLM